ncbi:hypothetical protein HDU78_008664 [Chytriomyces hyalinus]|nr:hypothetical protein HDU78_008664 [Chytriomyces hyalinus]
MHSDLHLPPIQGPHHEATRSCARKSSRPSSVTALPNVHAVATPSLPRSSKTIHSNQTSGVKEPGKQLEDSVHLPRISAILRKYSQQHHHYDRSHDALRRASLTSSPDSVKEDKALIGRLRESILERDRFVEADKLGDHHVASFLAKTSGGASVSDVLKFISRYDKEHSVQREALRDADRLKGPQRRTTGTRTSRAGKGVPGARNNQKSVKLISNNPAKVNGDDTFECLEDSSKDPEMCGFPNRRSKTRRQRRISYSEKINNDTANQEAIFQPSLHTRGMPPRQRWAWAIRKILTMIQALSVFVFDFSERAKQDRFRYLESDCAQVRGITATAIGFDVENFQFKRKQAVITLTRDMLDALGRDSNARSKKDLAELERLTSSLPAFAKYDSSVRRALSNIIGLSHFEAGRTIIKQGHAGENFYIVASGTVDVLVNESNGKGQSQSTLGPGDSFGEMALLNNAKRNATIQTKMDVDLLWVNRDDFLTVLKDEAIWDIEEKRTCLESIPYFRAFNSASIKQLASTAKFRDIPPNSTLFCEGEVPGNLIIIQEGSCRLLKAVDFAEIQKYKHGNAHSIVPYPLDSSITAPYGYKVTHRIIKIGDGRPGDFFGEEAAIANVGTPHQVAHLANHCVIERCHRFNFSLVSNTRVRYMLLNRHTFTREIIGHPELLVRAGQRAHFHQTDFVNTSKIQQKYLGQIAWNKFKNEVVQEVLENISRMLQSRFSPTQFLQRSQSLSLAALKDLKRRTNAPSRATTKDELRQDVGRHLARIAALPRASTVAAIDIGATNLGLCVANRSEILLWGVFAVDSLAASYDPTRLATSLRTLLHGIEKSAGTESSGNLPSIHVAIERQQWRPTTCTAIPIVRCAAIENMLFGMASALTSMSNVASISAASVASHHGILESGSQKKSASVMYVKSLLDAGKRNQYSVTSALDPCLPRKLKIQNHVKLEFESQKKKDDMADAFMMATAYLDWIENCERELENYTDDMPDADIVKSKSAEPKKRKQKAVA